MAAEHDFFEKLFERNVADGKWNLDKVRGNIIRCIVALNRRYKGDSHEVMKQHVFVNAVRLLVKEDDTNEADIHLLIKAFATKEKTCYTCDWCPHHWAVVLREGIKEDAVRSLFLASPTCLIQHLDEEENYCPKFTPVDLLVMQKNPNMSLVRYFDLQNPKILTSLRYSMSGVCSHAVYPLHLAAASSENLELLQYLIQTHFAAVTFDEGVHRYGNPLSLLIARKDFPTFNLMLQCLLDASSDSDVIAIRKLIYLKMRSKLDDTLILKRMKLLLNANPSAAEHILTDNETQFHALSRQNNPTHVLNVMKLLLVHYPLGLAVVDTDNNLLPIHSAIEHSTVKMVKFMLQVYPSGIEYRAVGLMHCAVRNTSDGGMVPYLCSIAPQGLHDLDNLGMTPLARLCDGIEDEQMAALEGRYTKILIMCETDPTIVRDATTTGHYLPLPLLIRTEENWGSPTSDFAECFRLLLRLHPSAAGALNSDGESAISYAIQDEMDDYFIRLLLSRSTDAEHKALLSD